MGRDLLGHLRLDAQLSPGGGVGLCLSSSLDPRRSGRTCPNVDPQRSGSAGTGLGPPVESAGRAVQTSLDLDCAVGSEVDLVPVDHVGFTPDHQDLGVLQGRLESDLPLVVTDLPEAAAPVLALVPPDSLADVLERHQGPGAADGGRERNGAVAVLAAVGPGTSVLETDAPGAVDLALVRVDDAPDLGRGPADADVDQLALLRRRQRPGLGVGVEVAQLDLAGRRGPVGQTDVDLLRGLVVGARLHLHLAVRGASGGEALVVGGVGVRDGRRHERKSRERNRKGGHEHDELDDVLHDVLLRTSGGGLPRGSRLAATTSRLLRRHDLLVRRLSASEKAVSRRTSVV